MDKRRRRWRLCCCPGGYNITIESNGMRLAGYKTLQQSRNTYTRPSFNETTANKQPDHDKPLSWWWWWWCSLQVCLFVTTIQPHRRSQMENSDAPEISLVHKPTRTKLSWNILFNLIPAGIEINEPDIPFPVKTAAVDVWNQRTSRTHTKAISSFALCPYSVVLDGRFVRLVSSWLCSILTRL